VPVRPEGTRPPLFVVPGVGSRILYLRHLAGRIGPDQPIYGLHSRFLDDGAVYSRVEDLAKRYVRDLSAVQPHGPYRLLGFSYGGLVALEVARQLVAAGHDVEFLGVVDTRLPGLRQHGPWSILRSIPRRLLNLAALLQPLSAAGRRVYLRTRLRIARESARAHLIEILGRVIPADTLDRLMPHPYGPEELEWLAADRAASGRYEPGPYAGRITYFWAAHSQRPPEVYDHREGWAELALGGVDVRTIPGSHLTVMVEPLIRSTAGAIRDALDDAERAPVSRLALVEAAEATRRAG
jgi:thioesterase domain-containing protein